MLSSVATRFGAAEGVVRRARTDEKLVIDLSYTLTRHTRGEGLEKTSEVWSHAGGGGWSPSVSFSARAGRDGRDGSSTSVSSTKLRHCECRQE